MTIYMEKQGVNLLTGASDVDGDDLSIRRINGALVTSWPHTFAWSTGLLTITAAGEVTYDDQGDISSHPLSGEMLSVVNFNFTIWDGSMESPAYTSSVSLRGGELDIGTRRLFLPDRLPVAKNAGLTLFDYDLQTAYPGFTLTEVADSPHQQATWISLPTFGEIKSASDNGYLQARIADGTGPNLNTFETKSQSITYQIANGSGVVKVGELEVVLEGTNNHSGTLVSQKPDWAELRIAISNDPYASTNFASLGGMVWSGDNYVSENMTKVGLIADGPMAADGTLIYSFNEFDAQVEALTEIKGTTPEFDLHGPIWHTSLTDALKAELLANPTSAKFHIEDLLNASFAHFPFLGFDVNEVQRTTGAMDDAYDYWRGPINQLPGDPRPPVGANGSVWYEAFTLAETSSPGYWAHDPGYWWLQAIEWANTNSKKVVYQDFNFEAGRSWGAGDAVPSGFEPRTDEHLKRRRILDALNYALVHGFSIDAVSFQAHLRTNRAIDENDLSAFLWSVVSMGLGVEVTELDVEPVGAPAGSTDGDPEAIAFAGLYTERLLSLILANSQMYRVGGWSDWTPPGKLQRLAVVSRSGVTSIGDGMLAALSGTQAPSSRTAPPVMRRYMLSNGLTGDLWRAATDPDARGFAMTGNQDGTLAETGSGGATLPLVNPAIPIPKAPVAPVWSDAGVIRDYNPASMSVAFQWFDNGDVGLRLTLLAGGSDNIEIRRNGSGEIEVFDGTTSQPLGFCPSFTQVRVCMSWSSSTFSISFDNGTTISEQTGVTLSATPDQIRLMGDGTYISLSRACVLEVFKDPLGDAERSAWATVQGAEFASSADFEARAPFTGQP